jgi:hypothetical protein
VIGRAAAGPIPLSQVFGDAKQLPENPLDSPQLITFEAIMPATRAVRAEESGVKRSWIALVGAVYWFVFLRNRTAASIIK